MSELINQFAATAYSELSTSDANDNMFFSPTSIYVALSMTYCGARNTTAEEMRNVLQLKGDPTDVEVHDAITKLWSDITSCSVSDAVSLDMANRMWIEDSYKIKSEFQDVLSCYYKADASLLNFKGNPENSRVAINNWVADKTNQKVKDLIPSGAINTLTRLVITNAIYFKGKWVSPFEIRMTKSMPFYTGENISVDVPMMFQKSKFGYVEDDGMDCKSVTLSYSGCSIRMTIILPNKIDGLKEVERKLLITDQFHEKLYSLVSTRKEEVQVYIPKFTLTKSCSLKDILKKLGIIELFSEGASDLSGISDLNDLFVSEVIHKAFVEVNEEGTEAAAATGVIMMTRCAMIPKPVPMFKADHPFLFVIHDEKTRAILFMGRVYKF